MLETNIRFYINYTSIFKKDRLEVESERVLVEDHTSEKYSRNTTGKFWKLIACARIEGRVKKGGIKGGVKGGSLLLVWWGNWFKY